MEQYESLFHNTPSDTQIETFFKVSDGLAFGNIVINTDNIFNGTTSKLSLYGSNDNIAYAKVYQDNNTDLMEYTLTNNQQYTWYFRRFLFKYYKVVYTPGDASLGTFTANFLGKNG